MNRIITIILLFSAFLSLNAADDFKLQDRLVWRDDPLRIQTDVNTYIEVPDFEGAFHSDNLGGLPVYSTRKNISRDSDLTFELVNAKYEPLTVGVGELRNSPHIQNSIQFSYKVGYEMKRPVAFVSFMPLRKNPMTGEIERLVEFELVVNVSAKASTNNIYKRSGGPYADNSVLSSGNWYKLAVSEDGLYKLDFSFFQDMGLDPSSINPRNIRVYGNGGGMLPEKNADFRHDDLAENAIMVVGEGDGQFNSGDYVLFYGQGPHRWVDDPDTSKDGFKHIQNIYSDQTYYFITTDLGPGKRIGSAATANNPNNTVTTFSDYAFHEREETNLIKSGREWYGDYFSFNTATRVIPPFSFPNLVSSEPIGVTTRLAGRSTSLSSSYVLSANNQTVSSFNVDYVSGNYLTLFAEIAMVYDEFTSNSNTINMTLTLTNPSVGIEGWLDYIELNARRNLTFTGSYMFFRDLRTVGPANVSEFVLGGAASNVKVWDVTDPVSAANVSGNLNGSEFRFVVATDELREFVAFRDNGAFPKPELIGQIDNQNLHAIGQPDMVIVTNSTLYNDAETLAEFHRTTNGLEVVTVNTNHIYNEFSSGATDLSAIRDFMKMLYDRAGSDVTLLPRYLLLFGDASYDYKDITTSNNLVVPIYESQNSVHPIYSYATDDYFAALDDSEGGVGPNDVMDLAVGRIPVSTSQAAKEFVNKIKHYSSNSSFGSWRNMVSFIADDEDQNTHLRQVEGFTRYMNNNHPEYIVDKIYFDAYEQVSTPGGSRYPDVKDAINRRVNEGALLLNYTGHGGTNGWGHERVLDINDVNSWDNLDNMPVFLTATCEFSKFDDPSKFSAGEQVLLNPKGGAIAMVTTIRIVFSGANEDLSQAFLENAFEPLNGEMPTMGEAVMRTKNSLLGNSDSANNRKFVLLGDPAIMLAYPKYEVVSTTINGNPISNNSDTLKALKKVTITGEVRDNNGALLSNFNGEVFPTIYDKPLTITTLKNDASSQFTNYNLLKNILFKGRATVTNGEFSYTFIVPKDISFQYGNGHISYYAEDRSNDIDANGYTQDLVIGGTADNFAQDDTGPELEVYMNDEKFVFGGITDPDPLLLVKLSDLSGINTVGNGIGHDITGILDDDTKNTIVLNEFYESELDNFQAGKVEYPLTDIEEGRHSIKIKAWDVYNNSAEGFTEFIVASSADLALAHVFNYPNPFTTNTNFMFEHNRPGEPLFIQVKIFTVGGTLVKTIQQDVTPEGFRVDDINWNGLDDFGDKIGRGVYVYKLNVTTADGDNAHKFEKLVILR